MIFLDSENKMMLRKLKIAANFAIIALVAFDTANAQVLDAGNTSTFAINSSGNIVQWGTPVGTSPPNQFPATPHNAIAVTGGSEHGLALTGSGGILEWGGSLNYSLNPHSGPFTAIAAGNDTSFALRANGNVAAWGSTFGNNGVVSGANSLTGIHQAISAGGNHFLALDNEGSVVGRGYITGTVDAADAATTANITNAVAISAGTDHALAMRNDGTVAAWGSDSVGQVTIGGPINNAVAISAGGTQSLILKSDGTVHAVGQLGSYDGIQGLSDVVYVTAGSLHSYAVTSDGSFHAFGSNSQSQLDTPSFALPTTATWSTATSGDYLNSHRWSQGIPSTALSNAVFDASGSYSVNFGNDARALSLSVSGGGNVTFNQNTSTFNAGDSISIASGTSLTVAGTVGGSELTATNLTNSGTLNVSAFSTVSANAITNTNSGLINIATDGQLVSTTPIANTGTIVNNGTITGDVVTTGTGVFSGSGTLAGSGVTSAGGVLSPGNSVGLVEATNWEFGSGGTFVFQVNNATGDFGGPSGWDALELSDTLSISATSSNPFFIDIRSLDGLDAGNAANFNPANNYSWEFVRANSITGFAADKFSIINSGFANNMDGGSFSISQLGNSLFVNFNSLTAIPEPSSLAILTLGGVGFAAYKRRRKSSTPTVVG